GGGQRGEHREQRGERRAPPSLTGLPADARPLLARRRSGGRVLVRPARGRRVARRRVRSRVGGTVTWAVARATGGLSAFGSGTLAAGRTAVVPVSGNCVPPGGGGSVVFTTGQSAPVTLSCPP